MSLDNILLPDIVLQGLYSKSLYDLETNKSVIDDIQPGNIGFLGSNQKHITILVNSDTAIYLPDDELNFLLGILTACKLTTKSRKSIFIWVECSQHRTAAAVSALPGTAI
jgi:hypothetical protein